MGFPVPVVWKDIFRSGRYRDQSGEWHTFTPGDVAAAYRNAKRMGASRTPYSHPLIWEHDWSSVPVPKTKLLSLYAADRDRRADVSKHTFGWAEQYRLRSENGQAVLYAGYHIPNQADADQWARTKYCSPRVDYDLEDSMGRKWPGCSIAHVAATNRPIQLDQKPVFLSGGRRPSSRTIFLSGEPPMAKEDDDNKAPPKKDDGDKGGSGGGDVGELKTVLAALGHPVPDECSDLGMVVLALKTHAMAQDADPDGDETEGEFGDETANTGSVSPAMLSGLPTEARAVIERAMATEKKNQDTARAGLVSRFKKLEPTAVEKGLLTPAEAKAFERRLTGVNLSFTAEGDLVRGNVVRELEVFERAVRAVKANAPAGKNKVGPVNLSGYAFGPPEGPMPGQPGWEEHVKKHAETVADRAAGGKK